MYIGKERRVSTIADRRVNKTVALLGGIRAGLDYGVGVTLYVADRRAKTIDDLTEGCPIEPPNPSDTAELLKKYRVALITAYELGKKVKETYQIVPPKVVISSLVTIGLQVN